MPEGSVQLLFLADIQIGCMATFSGVTDADLERFDRQGMCVRKFESTDSLDWDIARYRDSVTAINELSPDVAVIGGDMIEQTSRADQLDIFREITADSSVPIHCAPGNHDICADSNIPTSEDIEWYRSNFGPEHHVITHTINNDTELTIITVNSPLLDQPRKVKGGFENEMAWIENALQRRDEGPVIVVSHHPPFLKNADEPNNYWNIAIERRRPFLDLMADHGVDLMLCGHRHLNDHAEYRDIEIVTSSAAGFPLGVDAPGYRMIEVSETGISHTYYGVPEPGWEAIGGPPDPEAC